MIYNARGTTYQNDTITLTSGAANVTVTTRTYDQIFILPGDNVLLPTPRTRKYYTLQADPS